ncbi:MAG TPA: SGNH/GDSL hydrolase family protein [Acidobacteriaceae bacterium]|nr:SGNH/GDSL hydrolase family protein [Acidobacteriaceae bacterium]
MMNCARGIPIFLWVVAAFVLVASYAQARSSAPNWILTWGASQQIPEPHNALPSADLRDATVRQIFHLSVGGSTIRVHVTNTFGAAPLHFTSVHIAQPLAADAPAIDPASDRALSFAGASDVTVPAGADVVSDPIAFAVAPLSNLAVTWHLDDPPAPETSHPGSRATTYFVHGDQVSAATFQNPGTIEHWYQVSAIDVQAPAGAGVIAAFGDSITDGHATTTNGNDRWTDVLAARLQQSAATKNIGVLNDGIGGNHLLTDGLGPNALARFDRDVLAPSGVRWLIVFEAINDLGGLTRLHEVPQADHDALVQRIIGAYQQMIDRAHAHGIRVFGATITPDGGSDYYHPGSLNEADRKAVNDWIRAPGHFDAVLDFDAVVRDPQQPDRMLPACDSGDHLHPGPAGYRAIGNSIPLSLFAH